MARNKCIGIREQLTSLVSHQKLTSIAKKVGLQKRKRKVSPVSLFWTVVLGFGAGQAKTIAALRRLYQTMTKTTIVSSSFYDRFTKELTLFFRKVVAELITKLAAVRPKYQGIFKKFEDVFIIDATVVRLHHLLEKKYPSTWTNHTKASAKLSMVICVHDASPRSIKVTEGRRHECKKFRVGKWISGKLLLFDLGFFKYQLFDNITRNKGYFISRLKDNADPLITKTYSRCRGRAIELEGNRLRDIEAGLRREVIDAEVDVSFRRREYAGKRTKKHQKLRLVGLLNEETKKYHFYVTNIPSSHLTPEEVGSAYAARWQIELVFNELKTHYRLGDIESQNVNVAETFLYSAIVTLYSK